MNTGMQGGYNLGWKLAHVLAGAPESLLDTYEEERLPVAAGVLGLSGQLMSFRSAPSLVGGRPPRTPEWCSPG
jgi:2-polyprenyl-6-methoxyphenol hydroxylase-like FAD-dependent oxidoreductase